jgi:O-antigen/teichoic acid export membrane protein
MGLDSCSLGPRQISARARLGRKGAPAMGIARLLRDPAGHALGLMTLRSMTIAAKFALTLFITRYLGLAELGVYGIIASASALAPVLLGFGVANNLGREAAKSGPASITLRVLQYFLFLIPAYIGLCAVSVLIWQAQSYWLCLLALVLFLDHLQTEMFSLMTMTGGAYGANIAYFIRFAGWSLFYIPLALFEPSLRNLTAVLLFWLAGCVVASILTVFLTLHWRWRAAIRALPGAKLELPHKHGSMALYVGDVCNVSFVYLDRYIIGIFLSPTILGVYVLYWSITNALNNLITISVVLIERGVLVKVAQSSSHTFNRALRVVCLKSIGMALALGGLATIMMYVAVPHLGRPVAEAYLPLMFVLSAALILRTLYEVLGISFYAYGRDDLVLYSVIGVLIVALGLNLWLDPRIGIWGAGLALVASYAIGALARTIMVARGFRRRGAPSIQVRSEMAPLAERPG